MKRLLLLAVCSLSLSFYGTSQVTNVGGPKTFNGKINAPVVYEYMPGFDLRQALYEDSINDANKVGPWRFGYMYDVDISLSNAGTWTNLNNGARIWTMGIKCPSALSINLIFSEFYMPKGAHVHLYSPDRSQSIGAYTRRNHNDEGVLGSELILGEELIIEYYEPADVQGLGQLTVGTVVHGYKSLGQYAADLQDELERAYGSAGACNVDVNCTNFADPAGAWGDPINSVAMIVQGGGVCTGSLINNTCSDGTPYFLTADHCLGGANAPATMGSWAFRFNWQATAANSQCPGNSSGGSPSFDQTANGAALRANNGNSDFALLELTTMTVADAQSWGAFYSGWDRTDNAVSAAIGIHHPSGDTKKKCRENNNLTQQVWGGAQCWRVANWDNGVTEPGSSGSGLWDMNYRLIGQLYGGSAACSGTNDNGQPDYYGRFAVSWDAIAGNTNQLSSWLDACNTGATTDDGWDPNAPSTTDDAGITAIISPTGQICGATFTPEVTLRNHGSNTLTQVDIVYDVDGSGSQTFNWTGSLASNTSVNVTLPAMSSTAGTHTFNVATNLPNGVTDQNMANDGTNSSFDIVVGGEFVQLEINTDCWGYEVYWEIQDATTTVVASGGNTIGIPPGGAQIANPGDPGSYGDDTQIIENLCLVAGCYDFIIYDDYGDGMYGSQYPSCTVDGDYTITDIGMNVLASIQAVDSDYGNSETQNFCVSPSAFTANFSGNPATICAGETVDFTDLTSGTPTGWTWSFPGSVQGSSTAQNPTGIQYNTPGTYAVTLDATDGSNNDDTTVAAYITVNANPTATATGTDITCNGMDDGQATATASGGDGNYTYSWAPSGGSSATATGLTQGTYTVTVTDGNGCTGQSSGVVINEPTAVSISNTSSADAGCGASDGSITVTASGGTGSLEYSTDGTNWQAGSTLNGLAAGSYTVYVQDANGCQTTTTETVGNPNAPTATIAPTNENCLGDCDGEATATATGGTPGYTYQWDAAAGNQTGQTATGLCSGSYSVTVTDAAGCQTVQNVTVGANGTPLTANATPDATVVYLDQGGTVNFTDNTTGATGWSWDFGDGVGTSSQQNPSYSYTAPGTYTVTLIVTNGGCSDTITMVIDVQDTDGILELEPFNVGVYPNPTSGKLFILSDKYVPGAEVRIFDAAGKLVYNRGNVYMSPNSTHEVDLNVRPGVYFVHVIAEHGSNVTKVFVK